MLVEKTQERVKILPNSDSVIFLHLIGSHGPAYHKRYPEKYGLYKPYCHKQDVHNCSKEELINAYDNTILYTDYVISELINLLKSYDNNWNTALLYLSDHGESLGEYGLYLHGSPMFMAPKEQLSIPMLFWASESFALENKLNIRNIKMNAENNIYSHDNFFHSVLGLLDIQTHLYNYNMDVFTPKT